MAMNYRFAADVLMDIAVDLKQYDSAEFRQNATWLIHIAAEIRKLAPAIPSVAELDALKPLPGKSDPNSKIPRPVTPPSRGPSDALVPETSTAGNA